MFLRSLRRTLGASALLAACLTLAAQTTPDPAAGISGTITDTSGGAVSGAKITAVSQSTNAQTATLSDAAGHFVLDKLAAGSYTVKAELPGFSAYEKKDVLSPAVIQISIVPSTNTTSVDVSEKIDQFDVVPNTPTNSVFGLDAPLAEIPRSISVVPADMMTRYDIKTVNDLVTASPGSFTGSYFGVPGALFIRGEAGDNFYRGFRRVENRGNYETPVGDAEELEIVKGPPSPVYGGGKVGGYLNYTPKSARSAAAKWMEHPAGKIALTYGSYDQKIGSGEFGSSFKLGKYRGGFYTFFSAQDSKSFYKGIATRDKMGNIAFDMELPGKWRMEAGMQGFFGSLPQNIGWNRVTQQLVDSGTYLAGSPMVNLAGNSYSLNPSNFQAGTLLNFAYEANYAQDFLSTPQAALFALNPATLHNVHLNNNQIFIDAPDFNDALTYTGYFDLIRDFREGVSFRNQTFYDALSSQKFRTYGFAANYHPGVIENKSSLDAGFRKGKWLKVQTTSGFSYRYTHVWAGEERTLYQVIDRRDISVGAQPNDRFASEFSTNGAWGFNYLQQGNYGDVGVFGLANITLFNKLTVLQGVRYDYYNPDFAGQDNGEGLTKVKDTGGATTFNTSVSYRLPFHITPYFTASTARFLDLGQGGELDYSELQTHTWIQPSNLYEEGVKVSALDNKLYASLATFRQKHSSYNSNDGSIDYFRTKGVEGEVRAAISKKLERNGRLHLAGSGAAEYSLPAGNSSLGSRSDSGAGLWWTLYRRCGDLRHQSAGESGWPTAGGRQRLRNLHPKEGLRIYSRHNMGGQR